MSAEKLKDEIFNLESQVEMLKALGVFHVKPTRKERYDGKGEWLVFKRRGAIIVDESVPWAYRVSLPLERNKEKANQLLQKLERTKRAEELIKKINQLKVKLAEEEHKAVQAAEFRREAAKYKAKATEYAAKANAFRERAAYYTQQAAALLPA